MDDSSIPPFPAPAPCPPFAPPQGNQDVRQLNLSLAPHGYQWCKGCAAARPLAAFGANKNRPNGRHHTCRACLAHQRTRHGPTRRAGRFRRVYGMERGDYDALLARQGGVCAICGAAPTRDPRAHPAAAPILFVDHDHTTGAVRGLLCHGCNAGLGLLQDNPAALRMAARYAESQPTTMTDSVPSPPPRREEEAVPRDVTPPAPRQTMSKREAARHFGVSTRTIERRIKAGDLETSVVHGQHGPEVRVSLPVTPPDAAPTDVAPTSDRGGPVTSDSGAAVNHVAPTTLAATGGDVARVVDSLRAIVIEQQRRLEAAAEERGRLRAQVAALTQQHTARPGASWRFWQRFTRRDDR